MYFFGKFEEEETLFDNSSNFAGLLRSLLFDVSKISFAIDAVFWFWN